MHMNISMTISKKAHTSTMKKTELILDAATLVFLEYGFSTATTDMIQRTAGVSKSTLYTRYESKEALFRAVIERQCKQFADNLRAITPSSTDTHNILTEIGYAYLDIVLSEKALALYRVVTADAPRFPELAQTFFLAGPHTVATLITKYLDDACSNGQLNLGDLPSSSAASLFTSLLRGEGQMQCLMHPHQRPTSLQVDRWVSQAVEIFLRALDSPPIR
ncbi:TetR/AcrR family transcriptional regulator C-terminal domain-containing protein [Pseudomonas aeruginosa]